MGLPHMSEFYQDPDSPRPKSTPKTPIIAGSICAICIVVAWTISFVNWLIKGYRRRKLRKQRQSRASAFTTVRTDAGLATSARRSKSKYVVSMIDMSALDQPTNPTNIVSSPDSIPTSSSTTSNNNLGIPQANGNGYGDRDAKGRGDRQIPSWVPESAWTQGQRARRLTDSTSDEADIYSLGSIPSTPGGDASLQRPQYHERSNLSTKALPPTPPRVRSDAVAAMELNVALGARLGNDHERNDEDIANAVLGSVKPRN